MRRIFTLATGITIAVSGLSAQTIQSVTAPRPTAPGVEFSTHAKPSAAIAAKRKAAATLKTAPLAPRLLEPVADITTKDTLLVTGRTDIWKTPNHENTNQYATVTYDKYGHRSTVTYKDGSEYKYTYETNPQGYWTSKLVLKKDAGSSDFYAVEKEEREVNALGQLLGKKIYYCGHNYNYDTNQYEPVSYLSQEYKYDYSHEVKNSYNGETTRGFTTETIVYNEDGTVRAHEQYEWFEPRKEYIQTNVNTDYGKTVCTINGNEVHTIMYTRNYNTGEFYKSEEHEELYSDSGITLVYKDKYYNEDGSLRYTMADKKDVQENTPSAGWTTTIGYKYDEDTDTFTPISKREVLGESLTFTYGSNYKENVYYYSDEEGWTLRSRECVTAEVLEGGIYKITYGDNYYTLCYKLDEEGKVTGTVNLNADKSYTVTTRVLDDNGYPTDDDIIAYYDASHNLVKEILRKKGFKYNLDNGSGYGGDDEYTYYEKKNGEWTLVKEYEVPAGSGMGFTFRTVYKYTDEGYPASVTSYAKGSGYNNGEEFINEQTVYTYSANGYKKEEYSVWSPSKLKLEMDAYYTYYILEDGTYEYVHIEYDDDKATSGTVLEGEKQTVKDGLSKTYKYDKKLGGFGDEPYYTNFNEYTQTIEEDGTVVSVKRRLDDNENIVNESMTRSKYTDEGDGDSYESFRSEESFVWDETTNSWKNERKYTSKSTSFYFGCIDDRNPFDYYDDEYLPHSNSYLDKQNQHISLDFSNSYTWDEATARWKNDYGEDKDYSYAIDGNKLTVVETKKNENDSETYSSIETTVYVLDDNQMLASKTIDRHESRFYKEDNWKSENARKDAYTYKYNKYGKLEEQEQTTYSGEQEASEWQNTDITRYTYEEAAIIVSHIESLPEASTAQGIRIDGKTITAAEGGNVYLFGTDGRLCAKGRGSVTAPGAGLYVVKVGNQTLKAIVR